MHCIGQMATRFKVLLPKRLFYLFSLHCYCSCFLIRMPLLIGFPPRTYIFCSFYLRRLQRKCPTSCPRFQRRNSKSSKNHLKIIVYILRLVVCTPINTLIASVNPFAFQKTGTQEHESFRGSLVLLFLIVQRDSQTFRI